MHTSQGFYLLILIEVHSLFSWQISNHARSAACFGWISDSENADFKVMVRAYSIKPHLEINVNSILCCKMFVQNSLSNCKQLKER